MELWTEIQIRLEKPYEMKYLMHLEISKKILFYIQLRIDLITL